MPEKPIPEHPDDPQSLRDLLRLAVTVARKQAAVAEILGVDPSTISKYLSADRQEGLGWHVVVGALRGVALLGPDQAARVVQGVALRWFDLRGTWIPAVDPGARTFAEESEEVVEAHGETVRAFRSGDPVAVARASTRLVRKVIELASVSQQQAAS